MRAPLILGLAASLGFIAAGTYVTWKNVHDSIEDQEWVNHTNRVLVQVHQTFTRVRECESSVRGFALTMEPEYLAEFERERAELLQDAGRLAALTRDNPGQQKRIAALSPLLEERSRNFDRHILARKVGGFEAAAQEVRAGRPLSLKIHELLDEIEKDELRLLELRNRDSDRSRGRLQSFFYSLGVVSAVVVTGLFALSWRQSEARRLAETVLQDLYDNAPCGYHTIDARGVIVKANATLLRWLGYSREEVEGKMSVRQLLEPAEQLGFDERWAEFRQKAVPIQHVERTYVGKDGRRLPLLLSGTVEKSRNGDFLSARFSLFDISDRKRVERDLDQFFTTSLDLMGIADAKEGRFLRVGPSWTKTLGWSAEEICSKPWLDFVHPDDVASTVAAAQGLARGEPAVFFENRYRCRDGSYRWLSWKVPAPAPGESLLYAVARDITEFKKTTDQIKSLNEELARKVDEALAANKELEAFTYTVSHDLRAPLRAIDGFGRILVEDHGAALGPEGNRVVAVMTGNTRKMGQLIDDLLQFSRLGRKELEKMRVDMTDLAREAVEESRRANPGRTVEVRIDDLPPVQGDRTLLRQVWVNLVSNAFKYSRPAASARIEIGAAREGGSTVYHVRDNGVGFDMKYADKLFGVFQRLHAKTEFEGTGVGLAIVHRVIQRHHGRVWAESRPGEGAVFRFSIPA